MNGYFQIFEKGGKCWVRLIPPTGDGAPIRRDELLDYLSLKNMTYDLKALGAMLSELTQISEFPTQTDFRFKEGEYVKVSCAPDNMTVSVRMIPCYEGGQMMSKEEFLREFTSRGICYGFDDAAIDAFLKNRPYCTDAILVSGLPVKQGEDAKIEYFFNTDPRVKPTLNEDGSVDFFNLNTINHCKQGDLLARLTPAKLGENGRNVKGEWIKPREVKRKSLSYGHNIEKRGDELYSEVFGHVSYVEGKVFVSNVFTVENVDHSVGNIDYDGSVCVNGNVCENFTIKAKGSIEVKGVVEGAFLEAGENITIARGMHGMHKGTLKAGGNIVTKFLENSTVTAGGFVEADSILHSNVVAGTDIKVVNRKGFIAGGKCSATNTIEVRNLGSSMGADTVVEVGMDATTKATIASLQKERVEIAKQLGTIKPVLEGAKQKLSQGIKMTTDQLLQLQKVAKLSKDLSDRLETVDSELHKYATIQDPDEPNAGMVVVTGDVYPGTRICIGDVSMVVKNAVKYCRFKKEGGDVKMVAIY